MLGACGVSFAEAFRALSSLGSSIIPRTHEWPTSLPLSSLQIIRKGPLQKKVEKERDEKVTLPPHPIHPLEFQKKFFEMDYIYTCVDVLVLRQDAVSLATFRLTLGIML